MFRYIVVRIHVYIGNPMFRYIVVRIHGYIGNPMFRYIAVRIHGYIDIPMFRYVGVQIHGYIDIPMFRYIAVRIHGYRGIPMFWYVVAIPEPTCQKQALTPLFALCAITPLFSFVLCKLCFCTYSARTSAVPTKTNLPRNSPAPVERVCYEVGKRSQLPFSPAKRTITAAGRRTSINH